jgi:quinoprotein glucose dehydrogenase
MFKLTTFNPITLAVALLASTFALAQAPEVPPAKPLPPGPMQAKVKAGCLQCHNASRITDAHFSRTQWSDELDKMVGLGAVVPDADRKDLLDYLTTNFGPQKGGAKKTPKAAQTK